MQIILLESMLSLLKERKLYRTDNKHWENKKWPLDEPLASHCEVAFYYFLIYLLVLRQFLKNFDKGAHQSVLIFLKCKIGINTWRQIIVKNCKKPKRYRKMDVLFLQKCLVPLWNFLLLYFIFNYMTIYDFLQFTVKKRQHITIVTMIVLAVIFWNVFLESVVKSWRSYYIFTKYRKFIKFHFGLTP